MSQDVLLDRQRLSEARDTLAAAKTAFDEAVQVNDSLEDAVDRPHGKSKLQDRIGWFEANWSGNREELTEMVAGVHEGLCSILDGWAEWETEASAQLDQMQQQP